MKKALLTALIIFVLIQLARVNKSVPKVDPNGTFESIYQEEESTLRLVKAACYDCHSYDTKYPWHSEIAPVSWWIKNHINHGRDELNFSLWNSYSTDRQIHKLEESIELIEDGKMPLKSYLRLHPEAQWSEDEKNQVISDFRKIIAQIKE